MRRISAELEHLGKSYRIIGWGDLNFPLERYPKYVMIFFLDIMQYRDDFIYGLCVLEDLTRAGVTLIPSLKGLYNSDKFANYLIWNRYLKDKISMPDTLCTINLESGIDFLEKYRKIVFKPISSSQGLGIELVETKNRLNELFEEYHALFLQELIPDRGYDLRTLVVGNQITAQYARYNPNKFLKNIHFGAIPKSIDAMMEIDRDIQHFAEVSCLIAKEIQKFAEIDIVGIDTLLSKNGKLYLIEWNTSPGFRGAEEVTKKNIAKEIATFLFKD
jgi:glutathione synthase/RimK-type ligase-like ATP-grasp enzyme